MCEGECRSLFRLRSPKVINLIRARREKYVSLGGYLTFLLFIFFVRLITRFARALSGLFADEFVVETVVSSSEFIVDDANARNFNDKTFGSSVVLKSPIELHNAYFAAGVLAAAIFIVAVVVSTSVPSSPP